MNCQRERCQGRLGISHTYDTPNAKYQRAVCKVCQTVYKITCLVEPAPRRGHGACSWANKDKPGSRCRPAPTALNGVPPALPKRP